MTGPRVVFPASLERSLSGWLAGHPNGHERGAIILFRKFDRPVDGLPGSPRYVAVDSVAMDGDWLLDSSPTHLRINLRKLPPIYWRCEQEGLELGFAHSHPSGVPDFSAKDDRNEQAILRGYAGCNGLGVTLVALVLCDHTWRARARGGASPDRAESARHVVVLGEKLEIHVADGDGDTPETLRRQDAAFGKPFNRKLRSLRAVVAGGGGTGSPTAIQLARSGIGELITIDGDQLDASNLNRVRGYRRADVGEKKAATLANYIDGLGLDVAVASIDGYLDRPDAVDALATADIIFGCTDDVAGRDIMNQAAYYYCLAYIDVGLTGRIDEDADNMPYLRDHRGRISTIMPEHGACLRCQGVVTEGKLACERALRERPELAALDAETLRREYYLSGGQESAPGVGPFTGTVADLGVATLMDLIRPYRRLPSDLRQDNVWIDFVHMGLYSNMPTVDPNCFCCGQDGLLNRPEGAYRLGMPALGRLDRA
jgi:molybdopterin-synthase adenylyltransferase